MTQPPHTRQYLVFYLDRYTTVGGCHPYKFLDISAEGLDCVYIQLAKLRIAKEDVTQISLLV